MMYVRMFVSLCVNLYTSRVILAALGFTDFGLYNAVGGIIAMFGFISGAMNNTISRFLTFGLGEGDMEKVTRIFSMSVFVQIILAIGIALLGETVGLWFLNHKMTIPDDRLIASNWVFQFSVITTVLMLVNVPYGSLVISHEKMSVFAYISIFEVLMKLAVALVIGKVNTDKLIFYAFALVGVRLIINLCYHLWCRIRCPESRLKLFWDSALFRKMFDFAGWSTLGNFFYLVYTQGINLMLNIFCGPVVNAARGIAVQVDGVVKQFASNVQTAINPQIIKSYAQNDKGRMYFLIGASSRYCFYLLFLLAVPIMVQAPYLLKLWLGEFPDHTVSFLRLTLVNILLDAFINPMFTANLATGKVKIYHVVNSVLSSIFIPITYLSLKWSSIPESVFMCIIIMNVIGIGLRLIILNRQTGIRISSYLKDVFLRLLPVVILTVVVILPVKDLLHDGFAGLAECVMITSTIICMSVFFIGITPKERRTLIDYIHHWRSKWS